VFKRVLIANRGEIALRVMRTCRRLGIETVAIYSEADRQSPHCSAADLALPVGGSKSADSYRNIEAVLTAARHAEAQAVHPGYGFLAENPLFAERCRDAKLTFIGPSSRVMRLLGDKAAARRTMKALGVPVIPGSEGLLQSASEARTWAQEVGFPVLLKATAGGGGKGMRLCRDTTQLAQAYAEAQAEAGQAFGDAGLYLERYLEQGRHIEVQFLGDRYGHAVHLGERECSVQRHHQKLIEESPSMALSPESRAALGAQVADVMAKLGYVGAGTMEFLQDATGHLYFMEVNARLQVEHPVTEMVTGVDLVEWQLRVAANERLKLTQEALTLSGHALECRINAEDSAHDFAPSPGLVHEFVVPMETPGAAVRLETYVQSGVQIPIYYDSLLAKLITHAPSREAARRAMLAVLQGVRIEGVTTTVPFLMRVLADARFARGEYHTGLVESVR